MKSVGLAVRFGGKSELEYSLQILQRSGLELA